MFGRIDFSLRYRVNDRDIQESLVISHGISSFPTIIYTAKLIKGKEVLSVFSGEVKCYKIKVDDITPETIPRHIPNIIEFARVELNFCPVAWGNHQWSKAGNNYRCELCGAFRTEGGLPL